MSYSSPVSVATAIDNMAERHDREPKNLSEYALSRTIFDYGHHLLQLSSNSSTRWEQCWQEAEVGSMTRQVIIVDITIDIIIIITDIIIIIITQHRGHKVILE